jgi:hypothetical protein
MPNRDRVYTLGGFKTEFVYIACWHCPRRGRYRVANLIAKYGPDMYGTDFLYELTRDCDHHPPLSTIRVCGAHFSPNGEPVKRGG